MIEFVERGKRVIMSTRFTAQTIGDARRRRALPPTTAAVVFLGDSRAKAWKPPELKRSVAYLNRGIGYDTSGGVLKRISSQVIPLQPDVVIVQCGVNDFRRALLDPSRRDAAIAQTVERIQQIVSHLHETEITPLLTTIFPVAQSAATPSDFWGINEKGAAEFICGMINRTNLELQEWATVKSISLFDAHSALSGKDGYLLRPYIRDSLHINCEGYGKLNQRLKALLDPLLTRLVYST